MLGPQPAGFSPAEREGDGTVNKAHLDGCPGSVTLHSLRVVLRPHRHEHFLLQEIMF